MDLAQTTTKKKHAHVALPLRWSQIWDWVLAKLTILQWKRWRLILPYFLWAHKSPNLVRVFSRIYAARTAAQVDPYQPLLSASLLS